MVKAQRKPAMDFEKEARDQHRRGVSCAGSVYKAFADMNPNKTQAPIPRSEGGKCGAVLSAEKILREMEIGKTEEFEKKFITRFGSLKCFELMGKSNATCNDFVGAAASIVAELIKE